MMRFVAAMLLCLADVVCLGQATEVYCHIYPVDDLGGGVFEYYTELNQVVDQCTNPVPYSHTANCATWPDDCASDGCHPIFRCRDGSAWSLECRSCPSTGRSGYAPCWQVWVPHTTTARPSGVGPVPANHDEYAHLWKRWGHRPAVRNALRIQGERYYFWFNDAAGTRQDMLGQVIAVRRPQGGVHWLFYARRLMNAAAVAAVLADDNVEEIPAGNVDMIRPQGIDYNVRINFGAINAAGQINVGGGTLYRHVLAMRH